MGVVHYGGMKGFVNSFSKSLAWEWAKQGVRVNNICPGWIVPEDQSHPGPGSFWNRFGFETMGRPGEMKKSLEDGSLHNMSGLPIPRLGRPEDIASLALFLASDVSSYITGQLISVSGGAYMP
jgi:NAD(P)-dependent dehydrogenase (short-subunit alcohol dehydrogenase family)